MVDFQLPTFELHLTEQLAFILGLGAAVGAALVGGAVAVRLRQPAIVGFILAGIILGPSALGLVDEREKISALAELGVLLLLFLVGMELSVRAFLVTWRLALTVVGLQVAISLLVILGAAFAMGFPIPLAILLATVSHVAVGNAADEATPWVTAGGFLFLAPLLMLLMATLTNFVSNNAAAAIMGMLVFVLVVNSLAIVLRNRFEKKRSS